LTALQAAAALILPLPDSCGLQYQIKESTHNAFKFGTALQKLALTYLLQYAEYARKYARKYAEYDQKSAEYDQKYAEQYAKYDQKYVQICLICNLIYCDILMLVLNQSMGICKIDNEMNNKYMTLIN
jgi:hypothetical protein